jgi:hypothetical protein
MSDAQLLVGGKRRKKIPEKQVPILENRPRKIVPFNPAKIKGKVTEKTAAAVKRQRIPAVSTAEFMSIGQPNQQVLLPIQSVPIPACFSAAILGALQICNSQGFEDYAESSLQSLPGAMFYAYVYMTQILYSYISNTTSNTQKVPMWLDTLGCALVPTTASFMQGKVSYNFRVDVNTPATLQASIPSILGSFFMWQNNPNILVNDYTTQVVPVTYTSILGQMAYNLLVSYTANQAIFPAWVGVDALSSWAFKDVSAFAVSFLQLGQSVNGVGSPLTEIDFETPVTCPIFCVFADYTANSLARYFRHSKPYAGDANYLGYTLSTVVNKRQIKSKVIPKFKQIDFFEFVDVFSLYLGKALGLWYHNTTQTQEAPGVPPVWPLTWLDTCIMLRQAIGSCLSPEVLAGQFMAVESASANVQFAPFLWGTNCYPSHTIAGLMLPIVFLEGIRCLQGVRSEIMYSNNGKKRKGGVAVIYPILGAYTADQPPEQYTYLSSEGVFSPVYTVNPLEIPLDLADCTSVTSEIVNVNSSKINTNLMVWNEFMTNLKANSCAIEALGSDKPPVTLHSIHLTNVCGLIGNDGKSKVEKVYKGSHKTVKHNVKPAQRLITTEKGEKFEYQMIPNPYEHYGPIAVTCQSQILKPIWSNWQNMIVLPTIRVQTNPGDTLSPTSYLDFSVGFNEPFSLFQSTGDGDTVANPNEILAIRHDRWASAMVRTVMSDKTSLEEFLCEEAKRGRGGNLGSFLGGMAGSLLEKWIPGATGLGQALGGLAPF